MKLSHPLTASVFGLALFAAQAAQASPAASFMPDNDLWMEDDLSATSSVSQETFNKIIDIGYQLYAPVAQAHNEKLVINRRWTDSTVNANCGRFSGTVEVNMYGGLARRQEVSPEGFALVLCHELGHAYGGAPFIRPATQVAAEGQADFYGSRECLKQVLELLPAQAEPTSEGYIAESCAEVYGQGTERAILCARQMDAGLSLGTLLSGLTKEKVPDYTTPDPTVVNETLLSYPATTQCRLDTYHNGILGLNRPACWFKN